MQCCDCNIPTTCPFEGRYPLSNYRPCFSGLSTAEFSLTPIDSYHKACVDSLGWYEELEKIYSVIVILCS